MKSTWLIEKDLFEDTEIDLIGTVKRLGYPIKVVKYIPMDDDLSWLERMFKPEDCVIYYGSLNLGLKIKKFGWIPGCYGTIEKYSCTNYYPYFGINHINSEYQVMTYGELLLKKVELFSKNNVIFVRPNSILKEFTGMAVSEYNFDRAYALMGFYNDVVSSDLPIIVSTVKEIKKEWRFVVIGSTIISGSLYRSGDDDKTLHEPCTDHQALEFAKEMAKLYQPDNVWVLDICLSNLGYKVMEIGCFSFAGLYGGDLDVIVEKVSNTAIDEKMGRT